MTESFYDEDDLKDEVLSWWGDSPPVVDVSGLPETVRREVAYANRGNVVEGSGARMEAVQLSTVLSFRIDPKDILALRQAADAEGVSISEFVRAQALLAVQRRARVIPEHSCGFVGCEWCDPDRRFSIILVQRTSWPSD